MTDLNTAWSASMADARSHILRGGESYLPVFIGTLCARLGKSASELFADEDRARAEHAAAVNQAVRNDERMGRHAP